MQIIYKNIDEDKFKFYQYVDIYTNVYKEIMYHRYKQVLCTSDSQKNCA